MSVKNQHQNTNVFTRIANMLGDKLATFLNKPRDSYTTFSTLTTEQLKATLLP